MSDDLYREIERARRAEILLDAKSLILDEDHWCRRSLAQGKAVRRRPDETIGAE